MRSAASALLLLGATACPASASATVIQAIASTWGCQFSATLSLFPEYSADSQEDFRILDSVTVWLSTRISASPCSAIYPPRM